MVESPFFNRNYQIVGTREFSSPGMTVFSFTYPIFKDWEVKGIQNENENECIFWFAWPPVIKYETPPCIYVEKRSDLGEKSLHGKLKVKGTANISGMKIKGLMESKQKNPNNVPYEHVYDSSHYEKGYAPKAGDWDWLVFFGEEFGVRIGSYAGFGSLDYDDFPDHRKFYEFDNEVFYNEVIRTFNWTNAPPKGD